MVRPDSNLFVIRTPDGKFLGGDGNSLQLVNDVYRASLFGRDQDHLDETLALLRSITGLQLEVIPLRMEEVFEICDRCKQPVIPLQIHFDGEKFLCPGCRK